MQRKRHINFKFWKVVESSTSATKVQKPYLHSIPTLSSNQKDDNDLVKNRLRSNVLYSIPCGCILALLLVGVVSLLSNQSCFATASASLSITTPSMSTTTVQGSSATVSTKVNVSVSDVNDYSLTLKVDNANLTNGSTVIKPGNAITDNTWGYKWDKDNTSTYKAPTTTGTNLTVPTLTNNSANFEGTLTFGAKFSTSAEAGHYRGSGTLSLVATPNSVTLSEITTMQEMTPEICAASAIGETAILKDVRDNKTYGISKFSDARCWMTEHLMMELDNISLTPSNTDISTSWVPTLTNMVLVNEGGKWVGYAYLTSGSGIGRPITFYSWCAASAKDSNCGSTGGYVATSICPKGWTIPSKDQYDAITNNVAAAQLTQAPYNFFASGGYSIWSDGSGSTFGCSSRYDTWVSDGTDYELILGSSSGSCEPATSPKPGTGITALHSYSMRCIARE